MLVNALKPIVIAAPYVEHVRPLSANRSAEETGLEDNDNVSVEQRSTALAAIEQVRPNDQRRQQPQRGLHPVFFNERPAVAPKTMPGPQILAELIKRMGGAGDYSSPGQRVNITV